MKDSIWLAVQNPPDPIELIRAFYLHPVTRDTEDQYDARTLVLAGRNTLRLLADTSYDRILDVLEQYKYEIRPVESWNIPMFSCLKDTDDIPRIVLSNPGCDYTDIGYFFDKDGKRGAQFKYGETHYKAAMLMGLVYKDYPCRVTYLGKAYNSCSSEAKEALRPKLCIRVPLIQHYLIEARHGKVQGMAPLRQILTESTALRRRSSTKQMLNAIFDAMPDGSKYRNNFDWK